MPLTPPLQLFNNTCASSLTDSNASSIALIASSSSTPSIKEMAGDDWWLCASFNVRFAYSVRYWNSRFFNRSSSCCRTVMSRPMGGAHEKTMPLVPGRLNIWPRTRIASPSCLHNQQHFFATPIRLASCKPGNHQQTAQLNGMWRMTLRI